MPKPSNVRITRADGTTLPCELVHLGPDTDGIDIWQIANTEYHPEHGDTLSADTLPGRTGLAFATPMLHHDSIIDMPRHHTPGAYTPVACLALAAAALTLALGILLRWW